MLIVNAEGAAARLIRHQLQPLSVGAYFATAAAGPAALQPFIPPWVDVLLPPAPAVQDSGQVKSVKFLSSAYSSDRLPVPRWPEVAVLGRSNVGKSSLVNYMMGSSSLAKVSATPGRTSSINLYLVNNSWCLADCPGYGYAKTSKTARADWHAMTQAYLKERSRAGMLVDVLLLVDASLPPRDMDLAGTQWLLQRKMPVTLVYTKCDKAKKGEPAPADNIASWRSELDAARVLQPAQFPTCAVGSSRAGVLCLEQHGPQLQTWTSWLHNKQGSHSSVHHWHSSRLQQQQQQQQQQASSVQVVTPQPHLQHAHRGACLALQAGSGQGKLQFGDSQPVQLCSTQSFSNCPADGCSSSSSTCAIPSAAAAAAVTAAAEASSGMQRARVHCRGNAMWADNVFSTSFAMVCEGTGAGEEGLRPVSWARMM